MGELYTTYTDDLGDMEPCTVEGNAYAYTVKQVLQSFNIKINI